MNFLAFDVETANEDLASICQMGLVEHDGITVVREWKSYVDPEDYFNGINVRGAIPLTKVTPRYSVLGYGGVSPNPG